VSGARLGWQARTGTPCCAVLAVNLGWIFCTGTLCGGAWLGWQTGPYWHALLRRHQKSISTGMGERRPHFGAWAGRPVLARLVAPLLEINLDWDG
jgi:hypothetical protein